MRPSILTFLAVVICSTTDIVFGQTDSPVKDNTMSSSTSSTALILDVQEDLSSLQLNSLNTTNEDNRNDLEDVPDGVTCTTLTYYENDGVVPIENDLTLSGVSGTTLATATVIIYENFHPDQDSLVFEDQNGISGSYDHDEGKLELTGEASIEVYRMALASVGYINTSEDPSSDQRRINFFANNGEDDNNFERIYINVIPVNDPPVISGSETVLPYYPGSGAVEVDTMISITDVDDTILWEGRVWMTTTYKPSEDLLAVAAQFGLTIDYNEETSYLRILGPATIEQYEIIMSAATYTNTNPDPEPSTRVVYLKVFDDEVRSNIINRKIEIQKKNSPPQIVDFNDIPADTVVIEAFKNISTEVIVRAIDPDNDTTKVTNVVSLTDHNTLDNDDMDDMSFTYTPDENFIGLDTIKVFVCDTGIPSLCDSAIFIVQVEPDPDAEPFVQNTEGNPVDTLYYETEEDVPLDFCMFVINPGEGTASISNIAPAGEDTAHGTLVGSEEGEFCLTFTPEENYNGQSIWELTICNDNDPPGCGKIVIVIDILPVNDAPVAVNDTITATRNYTYTGTVTDNDYDIDGDNLIVNPVPESNPLHGSLDLNSDGSFDYTADTGYTGEDSFTYVVCDDGDPSLCASAEVIIYVEDVALKVYNAVSPNGDDLNDFLYIEGIEYYPDNLLSIYDRYNNLVFETFGYNNNNNIWEGQANEGLSTRELPGETYFYILNPGDGTPLLKGFIMLKME